MSEQWPPTPLSQPQPEPIGSSNTKWYALLGGSLVVVFGLLVTVTGVIGFGGDDVLETVEAPVAAPIFQPSFAEGPDPFFPIELQLAGFQEETGETPTEQDIATGLFGGTAQNTCDPQRLIDFLMENPAEGQAWAQVQAIGFEDIPEYINSLTVRVLAAPTTVLNHGFDAATGAPYEIEATLDTGTAVLVDGDGNIRTRCYCGNPVKPKPVGHQPPRCLLAPGMVYVLPGGEAKRAAVPAEVVLTGRITTEEAWTEISWGSDDSQTGWTLAANLQPTLCIVTPIPPPVGPTPTVPPGATATAVPTSTPTVAPTPPTAPTPTRVVPPPSPTTPAPTTPTPTPTVLVQPLQIQCSISDTELMVGEQTEYSAQHVPDSISVSYAFDHGDGTIDRRNPSVAFYNSPGSYDVYVLATVEGDERRQLCGTVIVTSGGPDTVLIFCEISSTRISVGGQTVFTGSSQPGELPIRYVFDHGDGFREEANPSFATYGSPGTYNVTLEATYLGSTTILSCGNVTVDPVTGPVGCSDQGYVGLSEQQAISRAVSMGCAWRVTSVDGIPAPGTTDFRLDRVNFELDAGQVTRAYIG